MGRRIRVKAIRKEQPEVRLYVLALIALARQLQEEEDCRASEGQASVPAGSPEEATDGRN